MDDTSITTPDAILANAAQEPPAPKKTWSRAKGARQDAYPKSSAPTGVVFVYPAERHPLLPINRTPKWRA